MGIQETETACGVRYTVRHSSFAKVLCCVDLAKITLPNFETERGKRMSGSGGSGYSGGFEPVDTCDSLFIETQLSSPKDEVIDDIKEGDILDVTVQQMGATSVVVVLHKGQLAGGIAAPQIQKLRECIAQGTEYDATVTSKNDGQVRVRIKPKRAS